MLMSALEIRTEIKNYLEQIKDESFLKVVHSMLNTYVNEQMEDPVVGYDMDGTPLYASEAKKLFEEDLKAVEQGEYITREDLRKEAATWLKPTK